MSPADPSPSRPADGRTVRHLAGRLRDLLDAREQRDLDAEQVLADEQAEAERLDLDLDLEP